MFDWTLNLGHILTIVAFIASGSVFVGVFRSQLSTMSERMSGIEDDLKQLVNVLVEQGRLDERMNGIDGRIAAQGQRIDDLSRQLSRFFGVSGNNNHLAP